MPRTLLYAGCYTHDSAVAIRAYDASDPSGSLVALGDVTDAANPSFLAVHPDRHTLYAVSEVSSFDGGDGGGVLAYRIDPGDGSLAPIDRVSSHGSAPCYVSVTDDGRHLLVANYVSGTVAAYELGADGRFGALVAHRQHAGSGPHPRQDHPHAHCIRPGIAPDSAYAVDLGTDRVIRYALAGGFVPVDELALAPGSGPRHIVAHPHHRVAFIVCELDNTLVTADIDPMSGRLSARDTVSTLPDGFDGESIAAEVRVHPAGHRVYVSNRGHDSIAVFAFDDADRSPKPVAHAGCGGTTPRNFALHPAGRAMHVANQDSDEIVSFAIDPIDGVPHERGDRHPLGAPVCLAYAELGR